MKKSIPFYEWIFVLVLCGSIFTIIIISWINHRKSEELVCNFSKHKLLNIKIDGAVKKPGIYCFSQGVTLESILKKARPVRFANLDEFDLKKRIYNSTSYTIKQRESIKVFLKGAVLSEKVLEIKPGTKISSLKKKSLYLENADLTVLKSSRALKHNEEIFIPFSKK